jgi:hypothetical protein
LFGRCCYYDGTLRIGIVGARVAAAQTGHGRAQAMAIAATAENGADGRRDGSFVVGHDPHAMVGLLEQTGPDALGQMIGALFGIVAKGHDGLQQPVAFLLLLLLVGCLMTSNDVSFIGCRCFVFLGQWVCLELMVHRSSTASGEV